MVITVRAVRVLQTETGLVSLCNPRPVERQQIVMCEHLDAVIMPAMTGRKVKVRAGTRVCPRSLEHWLLMERSLMTSPLNTSMGVTVTPLTEAGLARVRVDCLPVRSEWSAFKRHPPSPSEFCCVVGTNWGRPECACLPEPI